MCFMCVIVTRESNETHKAKCQNKIGSYLPDVGILSKGVI